VVKADRTHNWALSQSPVGDAGAPVQKKNDAHMNRMVDFSAPITSRSRAASMWAGQAADAGGGSEVKKELTEIQLCCREHEAYKRREPL
jgi:hypothetical protein